MIGDFLKIVLVEDNDDHAELVIRSLEAHCVANKIIRFVDGESALNFLFQREEYANSDVHFIPNLILLDLRLPKVDGLEVLKQIKNADSLKMIPVVVLTSSEAEKDVAKAYSSYVNSYLVKPLDFDKFTSMMQELGFYWLAWNKNPF